MKTKLSTVNKEVIIGHDQPTVLIGERINPTGKKKLAAALQTGNLDLVCQETLVQMEARTDILDVNVDSSEVDEVTLLLQVVQAVIDTVDVPLSAVLATDLVLDRDDCAGRYIQGYRQRQKS